MASQNLYTLAADNSPLLLPLLRSDCRLASKQDEHGYSLAHAATSYGHAELLKTLVNEFHVDVNITDEDGETPLFVAESVVIAQILVEGLGAATNVQNNEGETPEEKIQTEGEYPTVAAYLKEIRVRSGPVSKANDSVKAEAQHNNGNDIFADESPGPVPKNMKVNVGTMEETRDTNGQADVDPEFRRRIEELASREDFNSTEGQQQLRDLVQDAVKEVDIPLTNRDVRQRRQ